MESTNLQANVPVGNTLPKIWETLRRNAGIPLKAIGVTDAREVCMKTIGKSRDSDLFSGKLNVSVQNC